MPVIVVTSASQGAGKTAVAAAIARRAAFSGNAVRIARVASDAAGSNAVADAAWYGLRVWIEQGFKLIKRGGWQWQRTRMTDPERAERLWLAVAVATLWLVSVGGETKFGCVDGPDFDGHAVDFDDLMSRLGRYREVERQAVARFEETCHMREEFLEASAQEARRD